MKFANLALSTSTTGGTGDLELIGSKRAFQSLVAAAGSSLIYYTIQSLNEDAFEVGIGQLTAGSPDLLTRLKVIESSNSDALVDFEVGEKQIGLTIPDVFAAAMYLQKPPAVAMSTVNVTLATALEAGDTLDGVTLAAGDRVLLVGQSSATENGLWIVAATGAPSRPVDFFTDTAARGSIVSVMGGTVHAGKSYLCTSASGSDVVDTNNLTWVGVAGGPGSVLPIPDSTAVVKGSADPTKQLRFEVDGLTTATTRVVTWRDANLDFTAGGTFPERLHATQHQHGGSDEVATATPGANAIPKAGAGGTLASGWIPDLTGTYQPLDATLTALAGVTTAADQLIYSTAADTFTTTGLTSFARTILDDTDAATVRTTIGLGTTSTPQVQRLGIGDVANNSNNLRIAGTTTGAASQAGISIVNTFDSSATTLGVGVSVFPFLAAASFTMPNLRHFQAVNASIGAGAAVTTQVPFYCPSLSGATNNYAASFNVAESTNNWNLRCDGTAKNLMNGPLLFGQVATEPTPGGNQAGIYGYDVAGTCEVKVVDEAVNRTQISNHPEAIMERHAALVESIGLAPVPVPWGHQSEQAIAGIKITADIAAALRCIEYLMQQSGKPIELIRVERTTPTADWDSMQSAVESEWSAEAETHDRELREWHATPFWLRDPLAKPGLRRQRPTRKEQPAWLTNLIQSL